MLSMRLNLMTSLGVWIAVCAASAAAAGDDSKCDTSACAAGHAKNTACPQDDGDCRASHDAQATSPATPRLPSELLQDSSFLSVQLFNHSGNPHAGQAKENHPTCQSAASCDDPRHAVAHSQPQHSADVQRIEFPALQRRTWNVLINDIEEVKSDCAASAGSGCAKVRVSSAACSCAEKHDVEVAADSPAALSPKARKAATTILELMQSQGDSVLEGTVFQEAAAKDRPHANPKYVEETVIKTIRRIDAEHRGAGFCPACGSSKPSTGGPHQVRWRKVSPERIETLREAACSLDMTASLLERRSLYHQADYCRELAARLRRDARHATADGHPPLELHPRQVAPPHSAHLLQWRINRLQEELEEVRQALRRSGPHHREAQRPYSSVPSHQP